MIDKPAMAAVSAAVALLLAWWQLAPSEAAHAPPASRETVGPDRPALPMGATASVADPGPPAQPVPGAAAASAPTAAASITATAPPGGAAPRTAARPRLPSAESYKLSRILPSDQGEQDIRVEGRQERIIGTRAVADEHGAQTILITRDEGSGALSYWQSGLRFALKPGQDHEAFVREHPKFKRRFVNTDYADVALDAADLAEAYRALAADPRVASVRLLALPRQNKLK